MPQPLHTANSLASNFQQVNSLMTDVKNDKSVRVIKDDTGTPVVILSKNGLQTTSPGGGIDVTSATDDQYTFNSSQNVFRIVKTVNLQVSITVAAFTAGSNAKSVSHGLTFTPAYNARIVLDPTVAADNPSAGGKLNSPALTFGTNAGKVLLFSVSQVSVDATKVYFEVEMGNSYATGTYVFNAAVDLLQRTFS